MKLTRYFLLVYLDHRESREPIDIYLDATDDKAAVTEAEEILDAMIGFYDFNLMKLVDNELPVKIELN